MSSKTELLVCSVKNRRCSPRGLSELDAPKVLRTTELKHETKWQDSIPVGRTRMLISKKAVATKPSKLYYIWLEDFQKGAPSS